jgi:16S rRNA (guanine(527)-N(7))-methyltransferase RsmG
MSGEFREWMLGAPVALDTGQLDRLESHFELLLKWNRVLNLTAIRDEREIVRRHYIESLFLAAVLPVGALRVVDVGSGAGFPGVPFAVARPECDVTLVESHQRKAVFLKEATRGWQNVRVITGRAEAVERRFDWVVSRAVQAKEVLTLIPALAERVALLTSEMTGASKIRWFEPLAIPGNPGHYVLCGAHVPRGT